MKGSELFFLFVGILFMVLGLVFSFWPCIPAGIAVLVLYGHTATGIAAGLFFDAIFGAPVGPLSMLHFPFLLFAVACVGLRILAVRLILPREGVGAL